MDNYNEYEYEEQRDEFGRTHEGILCSHCGKHIRAVDTLYNINKLPFCCSECVLNYVGASKLWFDAKEVFSKRIAESQDSELYALVSEKRIMEVILKEKGDLHERS